LKIVPGVDDVVATLRTTGTPIQARKQAILVVMVSAVEPDHTGSISGTESPCARGSYVIEKIGAR
jgi:hypothetical protein